MTAKLPAYYSRLAPFREVLQGGGGILTYHHVGPRPSGVRLKGLYVSPKLFARQITELQQAGFMAGDYAIRAGRPVAPAAQTIAITFDDGFRDVFEHAL